MELVFFSIMGDCVCKIVCQFFGMGSVYFWVCVFLGWWLLVLGLFLVVMSTPLGGWTYYFCFFRRPASGVQRPTWFPDILGNSSYPIFTKFGMQVYWVNSLYGIAFGDDSSTAN